MPSESSRSTKEEGDQKIIQNQMGQKLPAIPKEIGHLDHISTVREVSMRVVGKSNLKETSLYIGCIKILMCRT